MHCVNIFTAGQHAMTFTVCPVSSSADDLLGNYSDTTHTCNIVRPHKSFWRWQQQEQQWGLCFLQRKSLLGHKLFHVFWTTCAVRSLNVWLINDVISWDKTKAWASHFNSVQTTAPSDQQPTIHWLSSCHPFEHHMHYLIFSVKCL